MVRIEDGKGGGSSVAVDSLNRLKAFAVVETEALFAVEAGDAYNVNTGTISLSGDTAVFYIKNNEDKILVIQAIVVGLGPGTITDIPTLFLVRNPTTGTLISTATAVDMNENRDFGASKTLTADTYKGATGATMTNGDDIAQIFQTANSRVFANFDFELQKGNSMGLRIEPSLTSGTISAYVAIICYLKDA